MASTPKPMIFSFVPAVDAAVAAIWNQPTPTTSKTMKAAQRTAAIPVQYEPSLIGRGQSGLSFRNRMNAEMAQMFANT